MTNDNPDLERYTQLVRVISHNKELGIETLPKIILEAKTLKDKINQALELQKKLDDQRLWENGKLSMILFHDVRENWHVMISGHGNNTIEDAKILYEYIENALQNQHNDECKKAIMNESNFEVAIESNKALANENAKLHKKIRELQQAEQKIEYVKQIMEQFNCNTLTELHGKIEKLQQAEQKLQKIEPIMQRLEAIQNVELVEGIYFSSTTDFREMIGWIFGLNNLSWACQDVQDKLQSILKEGTN